MRTEDTDCLNRFDRVFKANGRHATKLVGLLVHLQFDIQHITSDSEYLLNLLRRNFVIKLSHNKVKSK